MSGVAIVVQICQEGNSTEDVSAKNGILMLMCCLGKYKSGETVAIKSGEHKHRMIGKHRLIV